MTLERTPREGLGITTFALYPGETAGKMGLDVPGLMFAGWWYDAPPRLSDFASTFAAYWPPDSVTFKYYEESLQELGGLGYQILAYVRILKYPETSWIETVTRSLEHFVNHGAAVAWAGGYECFVRYSLGTAFLGCYAAYTRASGLVCRGGLDEPLAYISDDPRLVDELNGNVAALLKGQRRSQGGLRK